MTIEATLERIAIATEASAKALDALLARTTGAAPAASPPAASTDPVPPKRRGRPPAQPPEGPPVPTPPAEAEKPIDSAANFLDDVAPPPTIDDVRAKLVQVQKAYENPERARKLLKQYGGVDVLGALPPAKFATVIAACEQAIEDRSNAA